MTNFIAILSIIATLESNGNRNAIGDNGRAYGKYQLHSIYIEDVNRIYGTNYTHYDAFDPSKASDIVIKYITYYGNRVPNADIVTYLRQHNGGGDGHTKSSTIPYVQKAFERGLIVRK